MFIIYFRRGKAYPFVEMPMQELTEMVVDGELVMSGEILNLREILLECPDVQEKFARAEQFLAQAYAGKLIDNPFVDFAVSRILEDPGDISIRKIADKTGYSQKHLIKLFRNHVGVTPKAFMKIIRFQLAISDIEKGRVKGWAGLALDCGYYDQAHFIHDFREFSGFTPRQLLDAERAFTNYVAIG
jgi:AraC-like DNA-binding protein